MENQESMEFDELYNRFKSELGQLESKQREYAKQKNALLAEYNSVVKDYHDLEKIGETKTAEALVPKIDELKRQIAAVDIQLSAVSGSKLSDILETIQRYPESNLHKMGVTIRDLGIRRMEVLSQEAESVFCEITKRKKEYLELLESLGNKERDLFNTYAKTAKAEKVMSREDRRAKQPPAAQGWPMLEIEGKEVVKAYGTRPFIVGL